MPEFPTRSFPTQAILHTQAPLEVWDEVKKQAQRSPMVRFRSGAVIFQPDGTIIGTGCSHPDISRARISASIHAEQHAIRRSGPNLEGCWCAIYTYGRRGGVAWSSRPCYSCAKRLFDVGIERVIWAERQETHWRMLAVHPEELLEYSYLPEGPFARQQKTTLPEEASYASRR